MSQEDLLSDEEYQQLLMGGTAQQSLQRAMELQQKQAERMRGATPEGQMVSGRYVTPNILQYAGEMAKNYSSQKLQQGALETGNKISEAQGGQNSLILQALKRNRQLNTRPAAPAPTVAPVEAFRINDSEA